MSEKMYRLVTYKRIAFGVPGSYSKLVDLMDRMNTNETNKEIVYGLEEVEEENHKE